MAKTVSALETLASDKILTSNPSPFKTIVRSRFSAAASAIVIFFSIIFVEIFFGLPQVEKLLSVPRYHHQL